MGNAGSVDSQQTEFRAHGVPLKLPMPEPGELEERFAVVLVSAGPIVCGARGGRAGRRPPRRREGLRGGVETAGNGKSCGRGRPETRRGRRWARVGGAGSGRGALSGGARSRAARGERCRGADTCGRLGDFGSRRLFPFTWGAQRAGRPERRSSGCSRGRAELRPAAEVAECVRALDR